ncbi:MAG: thermonuclease family protein [Cytophagales bacterium]|nr:thermonuclease family protein [Cytophagales bacterium]
MKVVYILGFMLCLHALQAQEFSSKIINVIDGNTFEIIDPSKETVKVMLSEVDAPELAQEHGEEARQFSEKLLLKKKVKVEFKGKDFLGNKLAKVTLKNDQDVGYILLENGWAMVKERTKNKKFLALQSKAKNDKLGLWVTENPTTPWVFRRQQTMIQAKSR